MSTFAFMFARANSEWVTCHVIDLVNVAWADHMWAIWKFIVGLYPIWSLIVLILQFIFFLCHILTSFGVPLPNDLLPLLPHFIITLGRVLALCFVSSGSAQFVPTTNHLTTVTSVSHNTLLRPKMTCLPYVGFPIYSTNPFRVADLWQETLFSVVYMQDIFSTRSCRAPFE